MQIHHALIALAFAAGLAACGPAPVTPEPEPLPMVPPVTNAGYASAGVAASPAGADPWTLTPVTPATNEIYCSFYNIGDDGRRAERVLVTEIAGVPAPAHIGLEGQDVVLSQVSKSEDASPQLWIYENAERDLRVEMRVTETAKGFESRDYEGTIAVTRPAEGPLTAITGTCGV